MVWVLVAEGVAIALLAVLVLGLLRSHALILKALHELGAGLELEREASDGAGPVPVEIEPGVVARTRPEISRAHDIEGADLTGAPARVAVSGSPVVLAFLTSGCSVCETFWREFDGSTAVPAGARLTVVVKEAPDESPAVLSRLARPGVEVVASGRAWDDYDIPGSPYFVLVEGGVITGEGSAASWSSVSTLLAQATEEAAQARAAAGRTGPGRVGATAGAAAPGGRDDLSRVDAELLGAGITPGHPSLYEQPDEQEPAAPGHDHDHSHDHSHDHDTGSRRR